MNAIDVLKEVKRRIVADPKSWTRGPSNFGVKTPSCLLSHIRLVAFSGEGSTVDRLCDARDAVTQQLPGAFSIPEWNNVPERTAWDVIAMLGKAIRRLESESKP